MKKIRPLHDLVVIKREQEEKMTAGGLFIPENAQQKSFEGVILSIGTGKMLESGEMAPMTVQVGSKVLFPAHSYHEVKIDNELYVIMHEADVLAVVEQE